MIEERESIGYLLGETAHLLRANAGLAAVALGVLTAIGVAADLYPGLGSLGSGIASLVLQYEISSALLVHYHLIDSRDRRRRLWALLGLNLLSTLGIALGLVLLILPGAYLFVRWSAAVPALIAEDAGVGESLGTSARAVEGRYWHVLAAFLVLWAPGLAGAIASALVADSEQLIGSLMMNLSINLCLIAGWHLAVAIYAGRQDGGRLAQVFE
ncbi:MAG: hypothetical protein QOJ91_1954 [Sphingomonadales bacterium]|jgi:hypothetical protein|nr:hypothetical protein [Sphingomonadales bacterium]